MHGLCVQSKTKMVLEARKDLNTNFIRTRLLTDIYNVFHKETLLK